MMRSHLAAALLATTCLTQPASATTKPTALALEPAASERFEAQIGQNAKHSLHHQNRRLQGRAQPTAKRRNRDPWWQ